MPRSSRRSINVHRSVGEHPAQTARRGDQRRGLAPDDLHVADLHGLARPDAPTSRIWPSQSDRDRASEELGDVGAQLGGDLGGLREQEVAGQDRDRVVPPGVHRRPPPAFRRLVDHVVVVQRGEVRDLDGRAGREPRIGRVAEVAREQNQERSEPLPTGRHQVRRRLGDELRVGPDRLLEVLLDVVQACAKIPLQDRVGAPPDRAWPRASRSTSTNIATGCYSARTDMGQNRSARPDATSRNTDPLRAGTPVEKSSSGNTPNTSGTAAVAAIARPDDRRPPERLVGGLAPPACTSGRSRAGRRTRPPPT